MQQEKHLPALPETFEHPEEKIKVYQARIRPVWGLLYNRLLNTIFVLYFLWFAVTNFVPAFRMMLSIQMKGGSLFAAADSFMEPLLLAVMGFVPAFLLSHSNMKMARRDGDARDWQCFCALIMLLAFPVGTGLYLIALCFLLLDRRTLEALHISQRSRIPVVPLMSAPVFAVLVLLSGSLPALAPSSAAEHWGSQMNFLASKTRQTLPASLNAAVSLPAVSQIADAAVSSLAGKSSSETPEGVLVMQSGKRIPGRLVSRTDEGVRFLIPDFGEVYFSNQEIYSIEEQPPAGS